MNLEIKLENWQDLNNGKHATALRSICAGAKEIVKAGGAFTIYQEEKGVIRKVDRLSEFNELMTELGIQLD